MKQKEKKWYLSKGKVSIKNHTPPLAEKRAKPKVGFAKNRVSSTRETCEAESRLREKSRLEYPRNSRSRLSASQNQKNKKFKNFSKSYQKCKIYFSTKIKKVKSDLESFFRPKLKNISKKIFKRFFPILR